GRHAGPIRKADGRPGQRPRGAGEGRPEPEGVWLPDGGTAGGARRVSPVRLFRSRGGRPCGFALATAPHSGMSCSRGARGEGAGRLTETLTPIPKKDKRRDQRAEMIGALNEGKSPGARVSHEGTFPLGPTMIVEKYRLGNGLTILLSVDTS